MVIDKLENSDIYSTLGENIKLALDYLKQYDFSKISPGKYEIDEDTVFAMVSEYETKDRKDGKLESHRKYLDIQYIAKGNELIGYLPLNNQKPNIEYNEENDIMFYSEEKSFVKLEQGMFAIFFPSDIHMPGIKTNVPEKVKKVVVKVKI
jgi:YhcH/YjgK/YiaL family protein